MKSPHSRLPKSGLLLLCLLSQWSGVAAESPLNPAEAPQFTPAANEEVRKAAAAFSGRGVQRDNTPPTPPKEALSTFAMRDGYAIDLMAAEPDVMQPLYMSWDSRGRMWVVEYLQYQFPAGLKVVSYDQHLRAQFDKIPEPPPRGVRGADRITVFEDQTGQGKFTQHRTVLDGLNMVTSALKGAGGIWVLNPPYLLFYSDANDDDLPDGDPQVMLSGFGMEDTHSLANSLRWGPDGWLYGANGSTTTGNVSSAVTKNVRFQGQHIWRFHPKTRAFELYAEGGGNTFSTEIDSLGRFFSGTNASQRGMHYDQGMSGVKGFGKHGPPLNPYAFGYFDHMETKSDGKRFSQAFAIYEGGRMPELQDRFVAANSLQNMCYVSRRIPATSTFSAEDEPELLRSSDRWFRPVDLKVGPDGCIYLADWYDTRLSHVNPVDDWSKKDGRIYRVRPKNAQVGLKPFNLHTDPVAVLIANLSHPNKWFRLQSALELNWRSEKESLPVLESLVRKPENPHAIDALFALHMLGGLDEKLSIEWLQHPNPFVRRWVVRCIGDSGTANPTLTTALTQLATDEIHPEVRTQLLCSAKRLPAESAIPILRIMMQREADLADQRLPLLLWWAIETRAEIERDAALSLFESQGAWQSKLARKYGAKLLAKRYAMAGGSLNFESCVRLYHFAKTPEDKALIMEGIASAFEGGKIPDLPPELATPLQEYLRSQMDQDLALAVKTGDATAVKKALGVITNKSATVANRTSLIQALGETGNPELLPTLLAVLSGPQEFGLKRAALAVAPQYEDTKIPRTIAAAYEQRLAGNPTLRDAAHRALATRKDWSMTLLAELEAHRIKLPHISAEVLQQLAAHRDPEIDQMVQKLWPSGASKLNDSQKVAELGRLKTLLANAQGDTEKGHALFSQRCASCHTLFNEGAKIGPELTGYERSNIDFWLLAILDPSIEIREGYGTYLCRLKDGQIRMGLLEQQNAAGIVLKDISGQPLRVPQSEISSLDASPTSLMPEGLLSGLTDAELRDLFAYLRKP